MSVRSLAASLPAVAGSRLPLLARATGAATFIRMLVAVRISDVKACTTETVTDVNA